ncbi:MAG: glycosyl transferase family 1 [Rhodomicrobium sp.]|nr:MAG: glycosyl transferase family 1 [Rhodomicrobium sp.]
MLHINNLSYRIEGRLLIDDASFAIPDGHKVGLVGRNGTGKTSLLKLIIGQIQADDGTISWPKNHRLGHVTQEVPSGSTSLIDIVLEADLERDALMKEAETATDPHRIADIQTRLVDIDAYTAPARAATILAGLGFDEEAQQRPASDFSGGWRMRVALAAALFAAPDILLLDEPSNYLDLEGTLWLEQFLRGYPHTVLMVSHNRELLNKAVTHILHLNQRKMTLYTGGYDSFEAARREQQRLEMKLKKKQDDDRRRLEAFVDRFRAKASKAKQAQSRLKVLSNMKPIAAQVEDRVAPFIFPQPDTQLGNPLIRLDDASVGYTEGKPILRDLNLRIDIDDRIGLLGSNGNGKSTLAKLFIGHLKPMDGFKKISKKCNIGYFAQHQMDELSDVQSPYEAVAELMPDATEAQKRSKCAQLGFGPDKADTKAGALSGGEKARLLFAIASFHGPHLLILDEPTNHLDVDSCEMLIHAINEYEGAVLIISHDRHLLEATVDRLWLVGGGSAAPYEGDMESYRAELLRQRGGRPDKNSKTNSNAGGTPLTREQRQEERRLAAEARALLAPKRKELKKLETAISRLQADIKKIDDALADVDLYEEEPEKAKAYGIERGKLQAEVEALEEEWLSLGAELEGAG